MKNKLYRLTVLGVEQTLKMKFFIILNLIMLIGTIGAINFETGKNLITKLTGNNFDSDIIELMVKDETNTFKEKFESRDIKTVKLVEYTEDGLKNNKVLVEIVKSENNIIDVTITSNKYINESEYSVVTEILKEIKTNLFSDRYNIGLEKIDQLNKEVSIERVVLTVNDSDYVKYEFISVAIAFIMYMLFIFVASTIASTIGIEKISKTTEYMLTGISEKAYLWYNILQVNIVFIIQGILSFIYFIIANIINTILITKFLEAKTINLEMLNNISFDPIVVKIIGITIIQTILCILILSIIQAIMTSKVTNMTDISNSSMLVVMFVVVMCFILPNFIETAEVVNIFVKIISCLPIISIVMLPKLILLHQISNIGIFIAIMLNVLTLTFLSIFGSKWFKKGLLDSGSSKKKDKRKKDEIYDMNKDKFKNVIFKISIAMLIYLVFSNVLGLISSIVSNQLNLSNNIQTFIGLTAWILGILPSYLYLKASQNTKELVKAKVNVKESIVLIFLGTLLVTAVQLAIGYVFSDESSIDIVKLMGIDFGNVISVILFIIQVSILPAIFEELLFRKAMLNMLKKYGNVVAIIVTSVAFGLMHQNLVQGIFAFFMGIILAFITLKTKSIIPAMLIHFLNNGTAVLATIASETNNETLNIIISFLVISSVIISLIMLVRVIVNKNNILLLEKSEIKINNPIKNILSNYMVLLTIFIFVIISIYVQIVLI